VNVKDEERTGTGNEDGVSTYELERNARIAANRARMEELKLAELATIVGADAAAKKNKTAPSRRGVSSARHQVKPEELRRSSRQAGKHVDGMYSEGVAKELPDGTLVLGNGTTVLKQSTVYASASEKRRPEGDLEFIPKNAPADEGADAAFIKAMAEQASKAVSTSTKGVDQVKWSSFLAKAKLDESSIAKVVATGVAHLAFLPSPNATLVAAGDKQGHIGLWRFDDVFQTADDDDGVRMLSIHSSYVSGLQWLMQGTAVSLLTCSYEGVVRSMDAETGISREAFVDVDGDEFSAMDTIDGSLAIVADNTGGAKCIDLRTGKQTWVNKGLELHTRKINTVSCSAEGNMLATSSTDSTVKIWDVRKLDQKTPKAVDTLVLNKSSQSAKWAPDGSQRLLVTCYDDSLSVFSKGKGYWSKSIDARIKHNCHTGRWVMPFRAEWTPDSTSIACGGMDRSVCVYSPASKTRIAHLQDAELMTAIPSRLAFHPHAPFLCGATNSGRLHIWKL